MYKCIVENVRIGKKVHQKTIQYLGRVTEEDNKDIEVLDLSRAINDSKRERKNLAKLNSVIDKIEVLREKEHSCIKEVDALLRKRYPSCEEEKQAKHAIKFELSQDGDIRIAQAMVNTGRLVYIPRW